MEIFIIHTSSNISVLTMLGYRDSTGKTHSVLDESQEKFEDFHPVRNLFLMWNHDFRAPSAERYVCARVGTGRIFPIRSGPVRSKSGRFIFDVKLAKIRQNHKFIQ